jgi:hypothetical protein
MPGRNTRMIFISASKKKPKVGKSAVVDIIKLIARTPLPT